MRSVFMLALLACVTACGGSQEPAVPGTPPPVALETVTVMAAGSAGERLFDGAVEAVEQATLTAQTTGRVVLLERDVDASVERGTLIMRLSGVEQRARLDAARQGLAEAEARAVEAAAGFERTRSVYERRLVPKAELDRAQAEHEAAQARLAAARAAVSAASEEASYTEIRAPFAGVVTRRYVDVGEAVNPGQPLAAIAAPGRLRVNIDVPQALAAEIRVLGAATVYLPEGAVTARELTVFPAAAAQSNTVRVRIDLPEGVAGLYPGVMVKAGFALGGSGTLMVPAATVLRRSEVTAVYVLAEDGWPRLRQVRLGRRVGDQFEILAGLAAGERIAADPVAATLVFEGR